jgi:hypothetical protein
MFFSHFFAKWGCCFAALRNSFAKLTISQNSEMSETTSLVSQKRKMRFVIHFTKLFRQKTFADVVIAPGLPKTDNPSRKVVLSLYMVPQNR